MSPIVSNGLYIMALALCNNDSQIPHAIQLLSNSVYWWQKILCNSLFGTIHPKKRLEKFHLHSTLSILLCVLTMNSKKHR